VSTGAVSQQRSTLLSFCGRPAHPPHDPLPETRARDRRHHRPPVRRGRPGAWDRFGARMLDVAGVRAGEPVTERNGAFAHRVLSPRGRVRRHRAHPRLCGAGVARPPSRPRVAVAGARVLPARDGAGRARRGGRRDRPEPCG
jgi:hypothetical protein